MKIKKAPLENGTLTKPFYYSLKNWHTWIVLDIFVFLYVAVLFMYLVFLHLGLSLTSFWGKILAFSTSPFNFTEIFSKVYSSPMEGYLSNGVFTVVIIFMSIFYYSLFALSKRVKPTTVFWTSVAASYIVSIFVWLITGAPSTGTSIIGFCMVGFLFINSLNDLRVHFKTKKAEQSKFIIAKVSLSASIALVSLFLALFFYSLGNSIYVHFGGGATCASLIFIAIKTPIQSDIRK